MKAITKIIFLDEKGENLLLFTVKENRNYLSVIDIETMTQKQQFALGSDEYGISLWRYENFMVVYEEYLTLFSIDENGDYTQEFSLGEEIWHELEYSYNMFMYNLDFDWNGEQLVFANKIMTEKGSEHCGFYAGLLDAEGLKYFASYESTLNLRELDEYAECEPFDDDAISIYWKTEK